MKEAKLIIVSSVLFDCELVCMAIWAVRVIWCKLVLNSPCNNWNLKPSFSNYYSRKNCWNHWFAIIFKFNITIQLFRLRPENALLFGCVCVHSKLNSTTRDQNTNKTHVHTQTHKNTVKHLPAGTAHRWVTLCFVRVCFRVKCELVSCRTTVNLYTIIGAATMMDSAANTFVEKLQELAFQFCSNSRYWHSWASCGV